MKHPHDTPHENYDEPDYAVELVPENESETRSVLAYDKNNPDDKYAGEWVRQKAFLKQQYRDIAHPWLGYYDSYPKEEIGLQFDSQYRHSVTYGGTGAGKTALILNRLGQHAFAGHGFMMIDPPGKDTVELLKKLPEHRLDDVIWVEPGRDGSKVVGINFLDVNHNGSEVEFQSEMSNVVDDVVGILSSQDGGYARMKGIWRNLVRGMILLNQNRDDENNYTLEDLYDLLKNKRELMDFAEKVQRIDESVSQFTHEISQMDEEVLEPASRRLQPWVENKLIKEIIAKEQSTVNIKEAVKSNKIIIVNLDNINDDAKQILAIALIRRLWSAVQAREANDKGDYNPYFLYVDELHQVAVENSTLGEMLRLARKLKLSINLSTQSPSKLPHDLLEDIKSNTENVFAMRVQSPEDAMTISRRYKELSDQDFTDFGRYQIWTKLMINEETSKSFVTNTFAPFPPIRTTEEAQNVIRKSLDTYGTERTELIQQNTNTETTTEPVSTDGPSADDLDTNAVISCVAAIQYRTHGHLHGLVSVETVKELATHYMDVEHAEVLSHRMEMMNFDSVKFERESGELKMALTQTGINTLFGSSGSASQAGGEAHRRLLAESISAFTEVGYLARPVAQTGGAELPDGEALLPITADIDSNVGFKESERQRKAYQQDLADIHPRLPEISDGKHVNIEPENSSLSKGARIMANLTKAVAKNNLCMYVVNDGTANTGRVEGYADKIARILKEPPLVKKVDENNREYYYRTDALKLTANGGEEMNVVMPSDTGPVEWRDVHSDQETLELVDMDTDETVIEFANADEINQVSKHSVPGYYQYDQSAKKYRVYQPRDDGGVEELTYDSKDSFEAAWKTVTSPFIPDNEFSRMPTDDDWSIMIIPDTDNEQYTTPLEYHVESVEDGDVTGELIEFSSGESFDTPDDIDTDTDTDDTGEGNDNEAEKHQSGTENADGSTDTDTNNDDGESGDDEDQQNLSGFFN